MRYEKLKQIGNKTKNFTIKLNPNHDLNKQLTSASGHSMGVSQRYYIASQNLPDYSRFPVLELFLNTHNCYPSSATYGGYYDYVELIKKVKQIKKKYYVDDIVEEKDYVKNTSKVHKSFIFFIDKNDLYFYIEVFYTREKRFCFTITCFFNPKKDSEKILEEIRDKVFNLKEVVIEEKRCLNILTKSGSGYDLDHHPITNPDIDFELNYNEDFTEIHELITERLSKNDSKGLVLLHGEAGTGKTNYIKYLINNIKKKIIYIPPSMAESISNPELIKFFLSHKNSILVIEDAESVLLKRSANESQSVSNILNLTDGLLSDCANIQVVATFNTDILNIDEALLRKGRLIAKYEFKELEEDKVKLLAEKIGVNISGKQKLSDIYNCNDISFSKKATEIGFNK